MLLNPAFFNHQLFLRPLRHEKLPLFLLLVLELFLVFYIYCGADLSLDLIPGETVLNLTLSGEFSRNNLRVNSSVG